MRTISIFILINSFCFSQTNLDVYKKKATFSYDSLELITKLGNRIDSLNYAGQSIKAERVEKQRTLVQKRLFQPGRIYIFSLINQQEYVYYSSESEDITLFSDFTFKVYRSKDFESTFNPGIETTSDDVLESFQGMKAAKEYTIKIKILPSKYSYVKRGVKGTYDCATNVCKLIAVN